MSNHSIPRKELSQMSVQKLPREKIQQNVISFPDKVRLSGAHLSTLDRTLEPTVSKLWRSEGHPINRNTGKYESGGPFHVTHSGPFWETGHVENALGGNTNDTVYSGPTLGIQQNSAAIKAHHNSTVADMDESSMIKDGTTAISLCAPTNPTANLSTALAETVREGLPSLPGIQSWAARTAQAKAAGSEYLNYQFGWAPLVGEVHSVVNAARHHRDIMQNYDHNEGRDIHRRFDFSSENESWGEEVLVSPAFQPLNTTYLKSTDSSVQIVCEKTRKRWFEGCFTYGGPSKTDSFQRHLAFGREADAVYGLDLTPDVLWNLTPWSWAVDWFTNTGDVIHNISNFANAGLVMRYGYMMEESTSTYYTRFGKPNFQVLLSKEPTKIGAQRMGGCSIGQTVVRKSRCPANPFGFGVGWEGLSPTQLAITAALGITRLL
jgi:hypothetical protein